ncbi:CHASE3 domain-containing protein [Fulvivirga ligni]|uniref:CHASE3 domain-containing protein n=1 Tax=Fulvivirga ligni TaxID=2904246 RepID=UPI001F361CDC|nr:CHASE3 domain-containing protein [Fulvivirga ligni]UII19523.1 CHASE3 domain-containing protein [Fulvivirga ligni]
MRTRFLEFVKSNYITVALSLLMLLILIGAAFTFYNRQVMVENTILQKQTEAVKENLNNIFESDLRRMDLGLRGYALTKNEQLLQPYNDGINEIQYTIKNIDSLLRAQKLDTLVDEFNKFQGNLESFINVMKQLRAYADEGNQEAFVALLNEDKGFDLWNAWAPIFFKAQAYEDELLEHARESYQSAQNRNLVIQIILILFSIPTIASVVYRLKKNSRNRSKLLKTFSDYNRTYVFNPGTEISDDYEVIIDNSIGNLKKASTFIKEITKGNYTINWEGLDNENKKLNKDNLVGDLIKMRDQMKEVKDEGDRRLWSTDGLAKFSDVARRNQNSFEQLTLEVVKFLANYLEAQQGSLFVIQDEDKNDDPYLELMACYAFDKKKYLEKKIDIGKGLVGQTYLEGQTVVLTDLPQGYINITSGLGDATPGCVIIVPMKYNERTEAVFELARFEPFAPHEIDFLEKAGEVMASSIYSTKINERTSVLLQQSREQAEAMRAQEEELRQNMEEMQATQEEMRRREQERERERLAQQNNSDH